MVAEGGMNLSGGQRQRIALARALVRPTRILLLDDAASALDSGTERVIFDYLFTRQPASTILFATHRGSRARQADRILALDHGSMTELGAPLELEARNGIFSSLLRQEEFEENLKRST
jgi:ABC-type multidrug transport system fused ATPase/permease subunit